MLATKTRPPDEATLSALYDAGDYKQALRQMDAGLLAVLEERPDDPELAGSALLVANVYRGLTRYSAAESFYLQALAGLAVAGKERPAYARGLAELAALYDQLDRPVQALELYTKARAVHEGAAEPDLTAHARCLQGLAILLDVLGRRRAAVECLRQARELLEKA
jgi:tetratricopeptide (TPR) repeat protein